MSNIVGNTFLNILILRTVDPYYYSNGIFTDLLITIYQYAHWCQSFLLFF